MSITDELREWASVEVPYKYGHQLYAIADRIDAEAEDNERFRREAEPFCDRLREASAERADVTLFGVDYAALPLDADGMPIHIGDMMERGKARGRVIALMLSNYPKKWGGKLHWGIQLEGEQAPTALDNLFHHYHAPTVEDVLLEACKAYHGLMVEGMSDLAHDMPAPSEIIAEYARRLRLREVDE